MPNTITAGTRLGPYEIHELIGRGGMGEVYRAKDGRLGRQVAVKVLPTSFAADADRLKRFEREARSAGQLNHPNVVAIYDIGTTGDVPYIVSELLDGTDLRARLAKGAIPPRKAVAMGIQIAKGLAAAHAKGIAHRDLKPENLMVMSGDHLKIVDFGLAKLTHADAAADGDVTGVLATQLTGTGTIMGTASYMAPEQIRQQPVDHRADLFSVGAILYEMLTAQRAFEGPTPADRISAILHDTPPELPADVEDAAPGLPTLIEHCLEKNVEDRFQCAHDLVFALQQVEAAASSRRGGTAGATSAAAGIPGAIGVLDLKRHTFRRTTYREGTILSARFASDGQGICYGAAWEGRPAELFWAYPGNPESRALGFPRTDVLAISATGEMAVSLRRHPRGGFIYSGMLARMPAGGGAPREILDNVYEADWSPDGRQLAIVREEAGMTRVEYPIGNVLYKTAGWVSHMRVAPDGKHVAFIDHPFRGNDAGGPTIVDMSGTTKSLSPGWSSARGLAWSPDGKEIVFTAFRTGVGRSLYRVTPEGVERPILEVPGHMTLQDISKQGAALVALENERMRMQHARHAHATATDLTWLDWTLVRDLSSDGSRILFDETGVGGGELHAVYLRGTDGSPAIRLGDGIGFSFSPDGQWALGAVGNVSHGLTLLPCGAGEGRFLELQGLEVIYGSWFPDGMSFCALAHEPGKGARLFRVDPVTGKYEAFSEEGLTSFDPLISPDGLRVSCQGPDRRIKIYPVDGGEPKPLPGVLPNERMIRWSDDGTSAFVFGRGELPAKIFKIDIASGERTLWKELSPPDPTGVEGITSIRMTPVGDSYGYSYAQRLNDLYVVEGLF
ncbi:MAG TPA: protein kinase [Candidatus Omnitrophota bacterium]|nr:protein kinase [Candidatus Omnitrophota bacterium]